MTDSNGNLHYPRRTLYGIAAFLHVICPLLFFTDLTRNPYVTQISILYCGLYGAVIFFVVYAFVRGKVSVVHTSLDMPLIFFFFVALLSLFFSWVDHPLFRLSIINEGLRVTLFLLVNCLIVFWHASQLREEHLNVFLRHLMLGVGVVAAGYGILQYVGIELIWPKALNPYNGRPVSTFGNPNFLSSYLVVLLPLVLWEFLLTKNTTKKMFWGIVFLLYISAIVCTMTRSSWIGAAVSVGLFLFFFREQVLTHRRWIAGILSLALILILFWPGSPLSGKAVRPLERLWELVHGITADKTYGSWHQRLMIWSCAWDMIKERPLFGKGWGCFELFYPFYQGGYLSDEVFRGFRTHANNAHNVILEIWAQTGFVGLGLFLSTGVLFFKSVYQRMSSLSEQKTFYLRAGVCGVAGMMADNFFGNVSLFFAVPAFLFFWIMGSVAGAASPPTPKTYTVRGPWAWGIGTLVIVLCFSGVVRAWHHWRADICFFQGFKYAKKGDLRKTIEWTEKSFGFRQNYVDNNYEMANAYSKRARWAKGKKLKQESARLFEKAVLAYDAALASNAGYDEIHFNRASALLELGRMDDAVSGYRLSLLINPLSLEGYRALGSIYLQNQKYRTQAVGHFQQAVFYYPRDIAFWNNLGACLSHTGKNEEALKAYAKSFRLDFQNRMALSNLKRVLAVLGRKDHPLLLIPNLLAQTIQHVTEEKWDEALQSAELLNKCAPENARPFLMMADIYAKRGDNVKAIDHYKKFLLLEPGHRAGRVNMGKVYVRMNKKQEARDVLTKLLKEYPEDIEVQRILDSIKRRS